MIRFTIFYLDLHPPASYLYMRAQEHNEAAQAEKEAWRNNRLQMLAQKSSNRFKLQLQIQVYSKPEM